MAGTDYESILCVKPQVHVFRIPPRPSNRGYRASDWKLDQPDWTGRLRVVSKGRDLFIKLEDKTSGELFAKCPVEQYPGIAVESVTDSSRYFVLRIMDDNGRTAFIGIGFEDRGDSFDLNVALQDHFKHIKQEKDAEKAVQELEKGPKLDLGFKEGQTIRINIATKKNKEGEDGSSSQKSRPRGTGGGGGGLGMLPPPPGGIKLPPPGGAGLSNNPSTQKTFQSPQHSVPASNPNPNPGVTQQSNPGAGSGASNVDLLLNFDSPSSFTTPAPQSGSSSSQNAGQNLLGGADSDFDLLRDVSKSGSAEPVSGLSDPWGDFTSASNSSGTSNDDNWVQF